MGSLVRFYKVPSGLIILPHRPFPSSWFPPPFRFALVTEEPQVESFFTWVPLAGANPVFCTGLSHFQSTCASPHHSLGGISPSSRFC